MKKIPPAAVGVVLLSLCLVFVYSPLSQALYSQATGGGGLEAMRDASLAQATLYLLTGVGLALLSQDGEIRLCIEPVRLSIGLLITAFWLVVTASLVFPVLDGLRGFSTRLMTGQRGVYSAYPMLWYTLGAFLITLGLLGGENNGQAPK